MEKDLNGLIQTQIELVDVVKVLHYSYER